MAVTKILSKKMRVDKLIRYVLNPDKTDDYVLTYCFYCDKKTAAKQMLETKARYMKKDGIQAFHIIQAFDKGEITPELAHRIGYEFIREHLPGYEVVLGTHVDKEHIHNHIAFNSVSFKTGMKYHSTARSYFREIRAISDRLCREHGLSVIMETSGKSMSYVEWKLKQAGVYTNRELFGIDLEECLNLAYDLGNFYALMEDRHYEIGHNSKYPTFKPYGAKHGFRAKLGDRSLTEEDILNIIMNGQLYGAPEVIYRRRPFIPYKTHGKLHGFQALVVSWMYVLGIIRSGKRTYYKVSAADVMRFERYKRDEEFLQKYGIDTEDQLNDREQAIDSEIERLTKTRIILNSKKKRRKKLYDALADYTSFADTAKLYRDGETGMEAEYARYIAAEKTLEGIDREALFREQSELYDSIAGVNRELRELRSELRIICDIRSDIPHIEETLQGSDTRDREQNVRERGYNEEL